MVPVKGGRFLMGDPKGAGWLPADAPRTASVDDFLVARTEISRAQYMAVMGEDTSSRTDTWDGFPCTQGGEGSDLPAVCMSWLEAVTYANRLSEIEGLQPAYAIDGDTVRWRWGTTGFRLLTEAEWEYAARAGSSKTWVGTSIPQKVCAYGNVSDASLAALHKHSAFDCDDGYALLAPVEQSEASPNAFGLRGMGGNVAEWVWDRFDWDYSGSDTVMYGDTEHVVRGSWWWAFNEATRVASRRTVEPGKVRHHVGFRIARSIGACEGST